jgi:transcriptional regulator with XRE-family HTH domain
VLKMADSKDDLAAQIRKGLEALDWSQSQLARASGVSQQMISRLLNGERKNPSPLVSDKILSTLKAETTIRTSAAALGVGPIDTAKFHAERAAGRGLTDEAYARIRARIKGSLADVKAGGALTPEEAAEIRARAEATRDLTPPRDPVEYERWKNRRLYTSGQASGTKLARDVLFATADYMRKHRQGQPDDIEEIAAERIYLQYEGMFEMMRAGRSPEEVCKALGLYVARLELALAQYERRIADLELQQKSAAPN